MEMDERIMMGIVRISDRFKKESSAILKKENLTFSQYNVLRILESSKDGKMTMTAIGNLMLVSGANITGIAKRLERNGFLTRQVAEGDERVKNLEITDTGRKRVRRAHPERETYHRSFLSVFSDTEKQHLYHSLIDILESQALEME